MKHRQEETDHLNPMGCNLKVSMTLKQKPGVPFPLPSWPFWGWPWSRWSPCVWSPAERSAWLQLRSSLSSGLASWTYSGSQWSSVSCYQSVQGINSEKVTCWCHSTTVSQEWTQTTTVLIHIHETKGKLFSTWSLLHIHIWIYKHWELSICLFVIYPKLRAGSSLEMYLDKSQTI